MKFKYWKTESLTYKWQYPGFWLLFVIGNLCILWERLQHSLLSQKRQEFLMRGFEHIRRHI